MSTGTHGKSQSHSCVSEMVKVFRIVTAKNGVVEIHENNGCPFLKGGNRKFLYNIDNFEDDVKDLNADDMFGAIGVSLVFLSKLRLTF